MVIHGQTILIWVICNSNTNNADTFPLLFTLLKSIVLKHVPLHKSVIIKLRLAYGSSISVSWFFSAWCVKGEEFGQRISCSTQSLLLLLLVFTPVVSNSGCDTNFGIAYLVRNIPSPFVLFFPPQER